MAPRRHMKTTSYLFSANRRESNISAERYHVVSAYHTPYAIGTDVRYAHQYGNGEDLAREIHNKGNDLWYVVGKVLNKIFCSQQSSHGDKKGSTKLVAKMQPPKHATGSIFFASAERINAESTETEKKHDVVYIAGPNAGHTATIRQTLNDSGLRYETIGDGKTEFNLELLSELKGKVSKRALIILDFHGNVDVKGNHLITTHNSTKKGHTVHDQGFSYTKDVFEKLTKILSKNFKGHIYLGSCHGEASIRAAHILPLNATLSTHTAANTKTNTYLISKDILLNIKFYPKYVTNITITYPNKLTITRRFDKLNCSINIPTNLPGSPDQLQKHIQKELATCDDREIRNAAKNLMISDDLFEKYIKESFITFATHGNVKTVKEFLTKKIVDPNVCLDDGMTALCISSQTGNFEMVDLLLNNSETNSNKAASEGTTPINIAAQKGHDRIVKRLLERRETDPNLADNQGYTPLLFAAELGYIDVVKTLVFNSLHKAKVNHKNLEGATPLFAATANRHHEIVRILLDDQDIQPNLARNDGATPIYKASDDGNKEAVDLLIEHSQIDPNTAFDGETPLFISTKNNFTSIMELLLDHDKTDPNIKNNQDISPLILVCQNGFTEAVRLLLLNKRINPNLITNANGYKVTPLYMAARSGHKVIVEQLLNHTSIDLSIQLNGRLAAQTARRNNYVEIAKIIEESIAKHEKEMAKKNVRQNQAKNNDMVEKQEL